MREIILLPKQSQFIESEKKYVFYCSGIGGGKTYAGAVWTILQARKYIGSTGLICANSYKQLTTGTLITLFQLLDQLGIKYDYKEGKNILYLLGSKIICRSLENFNDLRSLELGWAWGDEIAYSRQEAFDVLIGRLREANSPLQARFTSSPNGYNFMYDIFAGEKKTDQHELIQGSTRENIYLPPDYVDALTKSYDSKMQMQEIEGQFISIGQGRVYYAYDKTFNTVFEDDKTMPLWIGMDFNVSPLCAVVANIIVKEGEPVINVFDDISLNQSNTHEIGRFIKNKYNNRIINIVPDATGKALKTSSAGLSDHDILRGYGFNVMSVHNPYVIDRVNCLNNAFEKKQTAISTKCNNLTNDLIKVSYKEGERVIDGSDKSQTHLSDALGYLVYYIHGRKQRPARVGTYA